MKLKVENGKLQILETKIYECGELVKIIIDIDIKELAKALKPYLDAIPNHECKGGCKNK